MHIIVPNCRTVVGKRVVTCLTARYVDDIKLNVLCFVVCLIMLAVIKTNKELVGTWNKPALLYRHVNEGNEEIHE